MLIDAQTLDIHIIHSFKPNLLHATMNTISRHANHLQNKKIKLLYCTALRVSTDLRGTSTSMQPYGFIHSVGESCFTVDTG
jgi:hypothetical protein